MSAHQPAVNHHGPSIGQGLRLDSPNKPQKARGVIRHTVVRPAREVKLSDLPDLVSPSLKAVVSKTQSKEDVVRSAQKSFSSNPIHHICFLGTMHKKQYISLYYIRICLFSYWTLKIL